MALLIFINYFLYFLKRRIPYTSQIVREWTRNNKEFYSSNIWLIIEINIIFDDKVQFWQWQHTGGENIKRFHIHLIYDLIIGRNIIFNDTLQFWQWKHTGCRNIKRFLSIWNVILTIYHTYTSRILSLWRKMSCGIKLQSFQLYETLHVRQVPYQTSSRWQNGIYVWWCWNISLYVHVHSNSKSFGVNVAHVNDAGGIII